jgi:outer membrane biosynthesis protein TonB
MSMTRSLTRVAVVVATTFLSAGAFGPVYGAVAVELPEADVSLTSEPTTLLRLGDDADLDELEDAAEELEKEAAEAAEEAAEQAEELQEQADKAAEDAQKQKKPVEPTKTDEPKPDDSGGTGGPVNPVNPAPDPEPQKPEKPEKDEEPGKVGSPSPTPTPDPAAAPGKPAGPGTAPVQPDAATPDPTPTVKPGPNRGLRPDARPGNPATGPGSAAAGPGKAPTGGRDRVRGDNEARDTTGRTRAAARGQGRADDSAGRSRSHGEGIADAATRGRPAERDCLGSATSGTGNCDDQVVAGLSGPDQWRDGGGTAGERSEAFRLFDADPDLARAQQRGRTLAAGGSGPGWSEIGTAQLVLMTIVPPLILLALGYVALGRRYP